MKENPVKMKSTSVTQFHVKMVPHAQTELETLSVSVRTSLKVLCVKRPSMTASLTTPVWMELPVKMAGGQSCASVHHISWETTAVKVS